MANRPMLGLCACKKRTPFFCFVHKRPVCEGACLAGPGNTSHVNCVVKTYNEWIADADYDWPVRCSACYKKITDDPNLTFRLVCKCVHHKKCLSARLSQALADGSPLKCMSCNQPVSYSVQPKSTDSALKNQVSKLLTEIAASSKSFLPPAPASSSSSSAAALTSRADALAGSSAAYSSSGSGRDVVVHMPAVSGQRRVHRSARGTDKDNASPSHGSSSAAAAKPDHLRRPAARKPKQRACSPQKMVLLCMALAAFGLLVLVGYVWFTRGGDVAMRTSRTSVSLESSAIS